MTSEEALALRAKYGTWAEASRRTGISASTLKSASTRPASAEEPANAEQTKLAKQLTQLRDENLRLRAGLKNALRDSIEADAIRQQAFDLANADSKPPKWLLKKSGSVGNPGVPVTIWSDWHWDEVVRPEEVAGVNAFNRKIAHERVKTLVERTLDICFDHQTGAEYPGIVVGLLGDMFSGIMHEELAVTNEGTVLESLLDISSVIEAALDEIAKHFDEVTVPCVVGNHDRMTDNIRFKGRATTSYSWLLYCLLERRFKEKGAKNVKFLISKHTSVLMDIQGWKHAFTHGDSLGVSGGDGQIGALGPILRGAMRFTRQYKEVGQNVDLVAMGHWHDYIPLGQRGVVVNGALKGFDEYAFGRRFDPHPPSQALWFVHQKHGVTQQWPILLEDGGDARVYGT